MASRENQGMQIALIVFVAAFLISAAGAGYISSQLSDANKRVTQLEADNKKAGDIERKLDGDILKLKQIIGVDDKEDLATAEGFHRQDMALSVGAPTNAANYHDLVKLQSDQVRLKDELAKTAQGRFDALQADKTKVEAELNAKVKTAEDALAAAVKDLDDQKKKFAEHVAAVDQEKADLAAAKDDVEKQLAKEKTDRADEVKKLQDNIAVLERDLIRVQKQLQEMRGESFEVADGIITDVDTRNGHVYINLGSADQLREQITFSVYGKGEQVGGRQTRKAGIEVVEVLDAKTARCRIIDEDRRQPILPDDLIHTPLWQSNRSEHVAIAGKFDFDGDGQDDRDMLKQIISVGGGALDEELDVKGNRFGPGINLQTRYLIVGEPPEESGLAAYAAIQKSAQLAGVSIVTAAKFLDHVGWKNQHRVVRYGPKGNSEVVPPEVKGGVTTNPLPEDSTFKKRRPGSRGRSAYTADPKPQSAKDSETP